ncbi:MAG: hypothetical protein HMLIMOIP_002479 [Candidatus Nitrosomirales archaeon]|jgi:hypothetical protein
MFGCDVETPSSDPIFVVNCNQTREDRFIDTDTSLRVNTVSKGKIVKTIEAEKQIYFCDLDDNDDTGTSPFRFACEEQGNEPCGIEKKVERVLFTEIWEDLGLLPNDPVVKKEFLGFVCVIVLAEDGNDNGTTSDKDPEDLPARVESYTFQWLGTFTP